MAKRAQQKPRQVPVRTASPRVEAAMAGALGLLAFVAYIAKLYPTVAGGDSAELTLVAAEWGVAHPPGYPLYTLLGNLFSLLPLGSVAWRVNLLSATCDAAAAALLAWAAARLSRSLWAGWLAGGLFAFSPLVFEYAVVAEVFALNNLLLAALICLLVRYDERRERKVAMAGALACGLGMSNHHLFALYAVPAVLWVLWVGRRDLLVPRRFLALAGLFALGLLPYLYLPLASARLPATAWGDQTTLEGFLTHLLRREYGTTSLASEGLGETDFTGRLGVFFAQLPRETCYVGLLLAAVGIGRAFTRRGSSLARLLLLAAAAYLVLFCSRANLRLDFALLLGVQARFWQQPNLVVCLFAGLGFAALAARLPPRARAAGPLTTLLAVALALGTSSSAVPGGSGATALRNFAQAVLSPLPQGALLLASGDHVVHSLRYFQRFEGLRQDVAVVDQMVLARPWYRRWHDRHLPQVSLPGRWLAPGHSIPDTFDLSGLVAANSGRAAFTVNGVRNGDTSLDSTHHAFTLGMVERLLPNGEEMPLDGWIAAHRAALELIDTTALSRYPETSWEHEILRQYWRAHAVFAGRLLQYGSRHLEERRVPELAAQTLETVVRDGVVPQAGDFRNLGIAYQMLGRFDPAALPRMRSAWERYLSMVGPDAPDAVQIRRALSAAGP